MEYDAEKDAAELNAQLDELIAKSEREALKEEAVSKLGAIGAAVSVAGEATDLARELGILPGKSTEEKLADKKARRKLKQAKRQAAEAEAEAAGLRGQLEGQAAFRKGKEEGESAAGKAVAAVVALLAVGWALK
jgi:hypothetical protein